LSVCEWCGGYRRHDHNTDDSQTRSMLFCAGRKSCDYDWEAVVRLGFGSAVAKTSRQMLISGKVDSGLERKAGVTFAATLPQDQKALPSQEAPS
jgi:hypothetical protein